MPDIPAERPRVVDIAFWCWVGGAILTAALGMIALSKGGHPVIYGGGALLAAAGLALGYLAGRARGGDARFARAATTLATTTVALLAVVLLTFPNVGLFGLAMIAVAMVGLMTGAVLVRRESVREWLGRESGGRS